MAAASHRDSKLQRTGGAYACLRSLIRRRVPAVGYFRREQAPNVLLTTCYAPSRLMYHFLADMLEVLPCATFYKRQVSLPAPFSTLGHWCSCRSLLSRQRVLQAQPRSCVASASFGYPSLEDEYMLCQLRCMVRGCLHKTCSPAAS